MVSWPSRSSRLIWGDKLLHNQLGGAAGECQISNARARGRVLDLRRLPVLEQGGGEPGEGGRRWKKVAHRRSQDSNEFAKVEQRKSARLNVQRLKTLKFADSLSLSLVIRTGRSSKVLLESSLFEVSLKVLFGSFLLLRGAPGIWRKAT